MTVKFLIVDDEPNVCKELRKFLEEMGYNAMEAYSGDEAIETFRKEKPNIVLLDILMPGKDGLETLRELKALDPEVTVIMVTAVGDRKIAKQAMREGAFDYITKPVNRDYLKLAIKTKEWLVGGEWRRWGLPD